MQGNAVVSFKVQASEPPHNIQVAIVDNNNEDLQDFLQRHLLGALELNICTGYLSKQGLEYLEQWMQVMGSKAQVRLLVGMPNMRNWKYYKPTQKVAHTFLSMHLNKDDEWMCRQVSRLYATYQFEIRLQLQAPSLHAKLYQWTDDSGQVHALVGSSNLTQRGTATSRELNLHLVGPSDILHWFPKRWKSSFPYVPNDSYIRPKQSAKKTPTESRQPQVRSQSTLPSLFKKLGCIPAVFGTGLLLFLLLLFLP